MYQDYQGVVKPYLDKLSGLTVESLAEIDDKVLFSEICPMLKY